MKTIVLATDFSATSANAAKYSIGLAAVIGLRVELLNAVELPMVTALGADIAWNKQEYEFVISGAVKAMNKLSSKIRRQSKAVCVAHPTIQRSVKAGSFKAVLTDRMKRPGMMMVVLGVPNRRSPLSWLLLGNSTKELVAGAKFPVLLVPAKSKYTPLQKMLFVTDLRKEDVKLVKSLVQFAKAFHATIELVDSSAGSRSHADLKKAEKFINLVCDGGYKKVNYRRLPHNSGSGLLQDLASDQKADILVMVHRKGHGINGESVGKLTKKISAAWKIPVLILPERRIARFFNGIISPAKLPTFSVPQ